MPLPVVVQMRISGKIMLHTYMGLRRCDLVRLDSSIVVGLIMTGLDRIRRSVERNHRDRRGLGEFSRLGPRSIDTTGTTGMLT